MAVTDVSKDLEARTITVQAEFDAPIERVWQLYANPRLLEKWWGPPTFPATVTEHELRPGGTVRYFMTGPDGQQYHGLWEVTAVAEPNRIDVVDRFADESGNADPNLPASSMVLRLAPISDGRTTLTAVTTFDSVDAMQQVLDMGVEEGLRESMGQQDALLAAA